MTLKDWEEKRDGVALLLKDSYAAHCNGMRFESMATAALEFLEIPKPEDKSNITTTCQVCRKEVLIGTLLSHFCCTCKKCQYVQRQ